MNAECQEVERFRMYIYQCGARAYRHFAWRATCNPYHILISEVMLQQTQVSRVVSKYEEWLVLFPAIHDLARASLRDVLCAWSGLGYNRRAQMLHRAAREICETYAGDIPDDVDALDALPGIGANTAGSIAAFAFDKPTVFIETNIRTVFLHTFFAAQNNVGDAELLPLIAQTVDQKNPRAWYYALMDYGAELKRTLPNPSRRSRHHTKQSRFEGSLRQVRGAIIRRLASSPHGMTYEELFKTVSYDVEKVKRALQHLCEEQLLECQAGLFKIWEKLY